MLKTRVIPILLMDGEGCVKTKQFRRPPRKIGSMMQHVLNMQERDVDELIIIDIDATYDRREPNYSKIEKYAKELFCPLTIGGGISSLEHIKNLLNAGADKVCIKSAAEDNQFVETACQKFGKQCIVQAIDVPAGWNITKGMAVGEILLTAIPFEGMMKGYYLPLIKQFSEISNIPIIANGGCGSPNDMLEAIRVGASAVAAGSMFLYTDYTPKDCSEYLNARGIPCRI